MLMIKWGGGGGHKQTWARPSSHSDSARDVQNNKCAGAFWDSRYLAKWTLLHFSQCSCSWQIIKQVRKKKSSYPPGKKGKGALSPCPMTGGMY